MIIFNVRKYIKISFIFIFIISLFGCVSDGSSSYNDSLSKITSKNYTGIFVVNKTTKKDVFMILGPANKITEIEKGNEMWWYSYEKEAAYIPILVPIPIDIKDSKELLLLFDSERILKKINYSE